MTSYRDLALRAKELAGLLKPNLKVSFPPEFLQDAEATISSLIRRLCPYLPPTASEKRAAKSDATSAQIVKFTAGDAKRKRFFNAGYFQGKLKALPRDSAAVVPTLPGTAVAARDALILYYYRSEQAGWGRSLKELQAELEADYGRSPEAIRLARFEGVLRDLLTAREIGAIASRLEAEFPDEDSLKAFAKEMALKIPPQARGKKAEKKSMHERLAQSIYERGGVARISRHR